MEEVDEADLFGQNYAEEIAILNSESTIFEAQESTEDGEKQGIGENPRGENVQHRPVLSVAPILSICQEAAGAGPQSVETRGTSVPNAAAASDANPQAQSVDIESELNARIEAVRTELQNQCPNVCRDYMIARHAIDYVARHYMILNYANPQPLFNALMSSMDQLIASNSANADLVRQLAVFRANFSRLDVANIAQSLAGHYKNLNLPLNCCNPNILNLSYSTARGNAILLLNNLRDQIPEDIEEGAAFKQQMMNLVRIILGTIGDSWAIIGSQMHFMALQTDLWTMRDHPSKIDPVLDDMLAFTREKKTNSQLLVYSVWYIAVNDIRRGPEPSIVYEPHRIQYHDMKTPSAPIQWIPTGVYKQRMNPDNGQPVDFASLIAESLSMPPESLNEATKVQMKKLRTVMESKVAIKWINDKLTLDKRVSVYRPMRHLIAFKNGVWNALSDVFLAWDELTTWPENVGHYIDEEMPVELFSPNAFPFPSQRGIPKIGEILDGPTTEAPRNMEATVANRDDDEEVQLQVTASPFETDIPNPDWYKNAFRPKMPYFRRIFEYQGYGDSEFIAFAGLQGRIFTGIANAPDTSTYSTTDGVFTIPRFGVATNVFGVAGNGKSIVLQMISEMVPTYKCGILESREEEQFGRDELFLNGVWLIILDEFEPDTNLSRAFLKKAITGQRQKAAQKYAIHPVRGVINAPFLIASNFKSIFPRDDAGAFTRRLAYFAFKKPIPPRMIIDDIDIRMKHELPMFMVMCARALGIMMRLARHRSIWSIMPQSLIKERDEIATESNAALDFLTTGLPTMLIRDPAGFREPWIERANMWGKPVTYYRGPYMTMKDLERKFKEYCGEIGTRPYRVQWDMVFAKLPSSITPPTIMRVRFNPCTQFGIAKERSSIVLPTILGIGWARPNLKERVMGTQDLPENWVNEQIYRRNDNWDEHDRDRDHRDGGEVY